jgi:hypothetical protein
LKIQKSEPIESSRRWSIPNHINTTENRNIVKQEVKENVGAELSLTISREKKFDDRFIENEFNKDQAFYRPSNFQKNEVATDMPLKANSPYILPKSHTEYMKNPQIETYKPS